MATVISDRLRDGFTTAKQQFGELHDKALNSFTDVRDQVGDVPVQLRGAWDRVVHRLHAALDVPSREEYQQLVGRLDGIERKLDRLARKEKAAAPKRVSRKK